MTNATHRWNLEQRDDGLYFCDGEHDKALACEFQRMTPELFREVAASVEARAYKTVAQMLADGAETLRTNPASTDMSDDARLRVRLALDVYAERIRALKPSSEPVSQPTS